ncbi:MAG: DNA replication and repair protein RecF [Synergistaceae bacterium]|jgi:DNA replication and repair protein RecF|nr:DNA replication and repair protein RecF [Synergistaceae bacterium]
MRLIETAWRCFRNLEPRHQEWCPGLNVVLGPNGSGKTNLLESLNVLCGWGAFDGGKLSSLAAWDSADGRAFLAGRTGGEREIEVEARIGARASLRAGNEKITHSALRALLPSLSFLPGDVGLLDGPPGARRLFLDKLCALCSPLYARRLAEYKQLVRHRAALLRPYRGSGGLCPPVMGPGSQTLVFEATAVPLARLGGWIRDVRRRAVFLLAEKLSADLENGLLSLLPREVGLSLSLQGTFGIADAAEDMGRALAASLERERRAGTVLVGPHRDDLLFSCGERPASLALSRGQKRRVVMAAILAAGRLIEGTLRLKPILILDDIAAELDAEGRERMGLALAGTGWQVFASAADLSSAPSGAAAGALWHIRSGRIEEGRTP